MKFLDYNAFVLNENLQKKNIDKILSSDRAFLLLAVYDLCEEYKDWKISTKNDVVIAPDHVTIPIEVRRGVCFYTLDDKNQITYNGTRGRWNRISDPLDKVSVTVDKLQVVFDNLDKYTDFCYDYKTFYFPVYDWTYKFKDFNSLYGYIEGNKIDDEPIKVTVGDSIQTKSSLGTKLGFPSSYLTITCIKGFIDEFYHSRQEIRFSFLSGIDSLAEKKLGRDMALKLSHIPIDFKRIENCKVILSDPEIYNHSALRAASLNDIMHNIPDSQEMKKKMLKDFSDTELYKYRGKIHGTTFGI